MKIPILVYTEPSSCGLPGFNTMST